MVYLHLLITQGCCSLLDQARLQTATRLGPVAVEVLIQMALFLLVAVATLLAMAVLVGLLGAVAAAALVLAGLAASAVLSLNGFKAKE
jgi:hypothetical protein